MATGQKGTELFNVPTTTEGLEFVRLAKRFKNRYYHIHCRGRAKDRRAKGGDQASISTKQADSVAIYIQPISETVGTDAYARGRRTAQAEIARLNDVVDSLQATVLELHGWDIRAINTRVDQIDDEVARLRDEATRLLCKKEARR